jgi:pimeloyl-ACP methyl ester carboxylesterase
MLNTKTKGKATGIEELPISFGSHGVKLTGKVLLPKDADAHSYLPGTILCHGFGASSKAVEPSAHIMASQGIAALIFDFRGHGSSEGVVDGKMVDDIVDAWMFLAHIPKVDNRRIGLVGHSLGAMSAIMATNKIDKPHALVALACPPEVDNQLLADEPFTIGRWGHDNTTIFEYPKNGAFPWLKGIAALLCRAWMYLHGYRVRVDWQKFVAGFPLMKMSDVLHNLEDCSKLFVFCEGDRVTPYQRSVFVYEAASEPKAMFLAKGGFHTTPLMPGALRSQWIDWAVTTLKSK